MKVQAQAESGLLIRGVSYNSTKKLWEGDSWATSANARDTDVKDLHPTSTIDLTNWYKASSTSASIALPEQEVTEDSNPYTLVSDDTISAYRRLDTFAIRSASGADLTNTKLAVKSVSATATGSNTGSLNTSIRIGVRMHSSSAPALAEGQSAKFYIFAPNTTDTDVTGEKFVLTANYADGDTLDEYKTALSTRDVLDISGDTIPYADSGVMVEVFTWYEGEDKECKTANITNEAGQALDADDLNITVVFEKVAIS